MSAENATTGVRSLSSQRKLADDSVLFQEIPKLENALPGSYIEFENYLGQARKITWDNDFVLWDVDSQQKMKVDLLIKQAQSLILRGA